MNLPNFYHEESLWQKGYAVLGIDEVGRGAFAGPVGIGGVVFPINMTASEKEHLLTLGINDSKKLTPLKREKLNTAIQELCLASVVSFIDVATINTHGIGKATFMGMQEVSKSIQEKLINHKVFHLVDAFVIPEIPHEVQLGIVRGDSISISIAAASIVAKYARDTLMDELGKVHPLYGLEKHKGYGTKIHRDALSLHGLTSIHRVDFCHNIKRV